MTRGRLARLKVLEAQQQHLNVVIIFPDLSVRDGWGRPASVEQANIVLRLPNRAMTSEEIEAARRQA